MRYPTDEQPKSFVRALHVLASVRFWFGINVVLLLGLLLYHFSTIPKPQWWVDAFSVLVNLAAGGLVSFLFYYLVVYFPDRRKKRIIKANLRRMYRNIKRDILVP